MTYHYAMTGAACAAVYREIDGELVLQFYVDGNRHNGDFCDIAAIARATVAALNGTTAEPKAVWHPKAVEALREVFEWYDADKIGSVAPAISKVREALALVDKAPAEKVAGWAILDRDGTLFSHRYPSVEAANEARKITPGRRIVRLVEEPDA